MHGLQLYLKGQGKGKTSLYQSGGKCRTPRQVSSSLGCPVGAAGVLLVQQVPCDTAEHDSVGAAQAPPWLFLLCDAVFINCVTLDAAPVLLTLPGCRASCTCVSGQCLPDK